MPGSTRQLFLLQLAKGKTPGQARCDSEECAAGCDSEGDAAIVKFVFRVSLSIERL